MKRELPKTGRSWEELQGLLSEAKRDDVDWRRGRISGLVYFAGDDVLQVAKDAYSIFFSENNVSPQAFPSLPRLESEVVDMASGLFHGGDTAMGNMSTGGTESIFLTVKAARDWARANRPSNGTPEIIAARTAHPAFNKAAHYLGLRVTRIPQAADFRADVGAMAAAISDDTIMLVGSAPAYPHGVFDPIGELSELAMSRGLWLHVDACVGGFLTPFVRKLGYPVPGFDFAVPGVTSISADVHKHGYAAKGASTVLYRSEEYYKYQGFDFDEWDRGHYSTATFTGTKSGGAIAAAWAVMNYLGEDGYMRLARKLMQTKEALMNGVNGMEDLETWGDPELSIFTYGSRSLDIFAVADGLSDAGWFVNRLQDPPGIHMLLAPTHEPVVEEYLTDLSHFVELVKEGKLVSRGAKVGY